MTGTIALLVIAAVIVVVMGIGALSFLGITQIIEPSNNTRRNQAIREFNRNHQGRISTTGFCTDCNGEWCPCWDLEQVKRRLDYETEQRCHEEASTNPG
jgi:hypothetical protein